MHVLVTGGRGMLGRAFAEQARFFPGFDLRAPGREELDVRDAAAVANWADRVEGGWIVHCAATVDVERCARAPEAARAVIVEGTRHVVDLARRAGARLLYPQSFLVYDGRVNPIPEEEEARPLSLYGEMKLEAQRLIEAALDDALVIRMAGFFGGEAADKNFVGRIIPAMRAAIDRGETMFKVGTRVWQPTWTSDLAFNSLHLMSVGASGRYQMACHGQATFADIAEVIVDALGWRGRLAIEHVNAAAVATSEQGATRRPDVAVLSGARLAREHRDLQRQWQPTLHAYLQHPFFDQYRLGRD